MPGVRLRGRRRHRRYPGAESGLLKSLGPGAAGGEKGPDGQSGPDRFGGFQLECEEEAFTCVRRAAPGQVNLQPVSATLGEQHEAVTVLVQAAFHVTELLRIP